jgi:putative intracellular protease/amidase
MRRRLGLIACAGVTLAALGAAGGVALLRGDDPDAAPRQGDLTRCANVLADRAQTCYTREYQLLVEAKERPDAALRRISRAAYATGGSVLADCHGLMHTVGRRYVRARAG